MRMLFLMASIFTFCSVSVFSYNLSPSNDIDSELSKINKSKQVDALSRIIISRFTEPVHEIMANKSWGCQSSQAESARKDLCNPYANKSALMAPAALIAGLQWNDNPSFYLRNTRSPKCRDKYIWATNNTDCWLMLFRDGERRAHAGTFFNKEEKHILLLRSHFGDLQFLHSMRSKTDKTPSETKNKIIMWAEFMWKSSMGTYERGTSIGEIDVQGLDNYFYPEETIKSIFFKGDLSYIDDFSLFSLGSLIHMVQDSFSVSHVVRDPDGADGKRCPGQTYYRPARIMEFQNYTQQGSSDHAKQDKYDVASSHIQHEDPDVVNIVKNLRELFDRKADWDNEVKPYMLCIFELNT